MGDTNSYCLSPEQSNTYRAFVSLKGERIIVRSEDEEDDEDEDEDSSDDSSEDEDVVDENNLKKERMPKPAVDREAWTATQDTNVFRRCQHTISP